MKKDPIVFIGHIIESIDLIEKYSENLTPEKFKKDQGMQDAIVRRLEIIGEAVKNIPLGFRTKHSEIPWKQMAGMRDILIHEYFDIDLPLTWAVVKRELPTVKQKLESLLSSK